MQAQFQSNATDADAPLDEIKAALDMKKDYAEAKREAL